MQFGQVIILLALAPRACTSTFQLAPYRIQPLLLMDKCTCKHLTFEFQFVLSELTSQQNSCPFHSPDTSHRFWYFVVCHCICQIYNMGENICLLLNINHVTMLCSFRKSPCSFPTEGSGKTVISYIFCTNQCHFQGSTITFQLTSQWLMTTWILPAKLFFTS